MFRRGLGRKERGRREDMGEEGQDRKRWRRRGKREGINNRKRVERVREKYYWVALYRGGG